MATCRDVAFGINPCANNATCRPECDAWRVRALTLRAASPERRLDASQRLVGALLSPGAVCAFFLSCLVGVGCRALHRSASSDFAPG